jgi:hypothetical protein
LRTRSFDQPSTIPFCRKRLLGLLAERSGTVTNLRTNLPEWEE